MPQPRGQIPGHSEHLRRHHRRSGDHFLSCEFRQSHSIRNLVELRDNFQFQTRKTASWLSAKLTKDGHAVAVLSGDLSVEQRLSVLDRFREGSEKVLITTNVLSRGIDVEHVTIVVNFDLPIDMNGEADCETYLHRIGRTGRFGNFSLKPALKRDLSQFFLLFQAKVASPSI